MARALLFHDWSAEEHMKKRAIVTWQLLKQTVSDWSSDEAARLAAAMAFYTLLSLAPLVMVAIAVAGLVFGEEAARGYVGEQLASVVGPQAGEGVETVVAHARKPSSGIVGSIVGIVVLLFGASGVFKELQSALNTIWEVEPKPGRGFLGVLRDRFFSFTMVLGVAFLLLVSLVISTALSAVGNFMSEALPGGPVLWQILNFVISLAVITVLFALIFKVIPDVKIKWRDVWPGALATSLLFAVGKFALGIYLGRASVTSSYGAAGSLVVLVIWVYYATQILFLGAEFTQAYAKHRGAHIEPGPNAVPKAEEDTHKEPAYDERLRPSRT
jgi:membrane protein